MKHLSNLLESSEKLCTPRSETSAPHEIADSVNYIKDHIGFSGPYQYGYWLKRIKQSGKTYFQVKELVDTAQCLKSKYNKGGFVSNALMK